MDVTMPDGVVIEGVPDGTTKAQLAAKYSAHIGSGQAEGPQPTLLQTLGASPLGRFAHDAIAQPIAGLAGLLSKIDPTGGAVEPMAAKAEGTYQAALAAQRNRPGYADARAKADAVNAKSSPLVGNRGGLTDQLIAPFTSTMAGVAGIPGGLNAMNANADAQTAAQGDYQKRHPILSTGAQLAGGLLMAPKLNAPAAVGSVAPSIATLKNDARAAYNVADNSGHIVAAPSYDTMVADLQAKLANEGIDKTLHPNSLAAYQRLADAKGMPITFKGLDTQRKIAGDAIGASATNKADQRLGYIIQDHIDDFVGNLKQADILGGADPKAAINALTDARDAWSRASQAQTIQTQIDKAALKAKGYSQSGMENALRAQFRQLALNSKGMSKLSPEVQEAVKAVAKGSPTGNILRAIGKYAPHGPISTMAGMGIGSMLGGVAGAAEGGMASLVVPAVGEAARMGATKITREAAQRAMDTAALGKRPPMTPPLLGAPSAPGQLPYGLSLPLLMQTQRQ